MDLSNEKDFEKFVKDNITYTFENLTSSDFGITDGVEPSNYVEESRESIFTEINLDLLRFYTTGFRASNKETNKFIESYIGNAESEAEDNTVGLDSDIQDEKFLEIMSDMLYDNGLWLDLGIRLQFLPSYYQEYPECYANIVMFLKDDNGNKLVRYPDFQFKIGSYLKSNFSKISSEDDFVEDERDTRGVLANESSLWNYIENTILDYVSQF